MRSLDLANSVVIAAAAVVLASTAPASADIQYTNFQVANDVNVTLTCNSIANCSSGYYGSGQIDIYDNSQSPEAEIWCVDVTHDLQGPWSSQPGNSIYAFQVTAWQAQTALLSNIWSGGAVGLGSQLSNLVVGEIGALAYYGDTHINSNYYVSSAVQLAIWDIEYNGGALNLNGALKEVSDSAHTESLAESLVKDVQLGWLGYDTNVDWLTCTTTQIGSACNQGQIDVLEPPTNYVPEPSALELFGSGLLGLGGFMALRRRRGHSATR